MVRNFYYLLLFTTQIIIYCKTRSEAKKIGNEVFLFLKEKLKLPINREKSGIRKPVQFVILGYKYVSTYEKGVRGKYQLVVSQKSWEKFKMNLKAMHGVEREWADGE